MSNNYRKSKDKQIKLYIRINSNKKGTDFKCNRQISEQDFIDLLYEVIYTNKLLQNCKENNKKRKLCFILQGNELNRQQGRTLNLRQLSIIHVLDIYEIYKQTIQVILRLKNDKKMQDLQYRIKVKSNKTIQEQLKQIIPLYFNIFFNEISLVYLGHSLAQKNTFKDQLVQNESQIILIDKLKNGVQQSKVQKQQIRLQNFGVNLNRVKSKGKKPQLNQMGLNMPFNPKITKSQVKQILQKNIEANMMEIQQQNVQYMLANNFEIEQAAPQEPFQSGQIGSSQMINLESLNPNDNSQNDEAMAKKDPMIFMKFGQEIKMNEEKEIPTNESIEGQDEVNNM